jgi:hypothetical protein
VIVPDTASLATQVIDARDLAQWLVACIEKKQTGIFNATGQTVPFAQFIETARTCASHTGSLRYATSQWLIQQGVNPWMGPKSLPIWIPEDEAGASGTWNSDRAVAAGLARRPLASTLADTLAWEQSCSPTAPRRAGMTPDEERALLQAYERTYGAMDTNARFGRPS